MRENSGITHNPLYNSHWSPVGSRHQPNSILRKGCSTRKLFSHYQEKLNFCLATLAIGGIFLGGAYFFMVQLADFGW